MRKGFTLEELQNVFLVIVIIATALLYTYMIITFL